MSDISKIKVSGVEYDIKDIQARGDLGNLGTRVTELEQHGGGGGSTVELDTTLSEAGKAADAKAVGDALAGKQNTISDLEAIRSGAAKGATALQSVPKPLTYDYMPEGYPTKSVQTTTLLEEQELAFALEDGAVYTAYPTKAFELVEGQTYTVNWDGAEYERVCVVLRSTILALGNKSIFGSGDDTGEPFLYLSTGAFATRETSASHTISVKRTEETVTPIDEKYLPVSAFTDADWDFVSNRPFFNKPLNANITVENITRTFGTGDSYVSLGVPVPNFNEGLYYKVEGEITFLNNSANTSYTLQINGYYKADLQAQISLGTVHDESIGENLEVSLYGNNSLTGYARNLAVNLVYNNLVSYTISTNFTIISEVKQLSEDYIPDTIQRVGNTIIPSSTPDSTKKFKITVDDSGTISATEIV